MTKLTKTISRECATVIQGRPIIVSLLAGDLIEFRQKGRRERWRVSVESCLWLAVKQQADVIDSVKRLSFPHPTRRAK